MAKRAGQIRPSLGLGSAWPAVVLAAVVLIPVLAIGLRATGFGLGAGDWAAIRFTLWQAFLSALVSVTLAIPLARAIARRSFRFRGALITLLGAPFLLPSLVAALGIVAVFGRNGWVNDALALIGLPPVSIYGTFGVVLAHVFLNLPLATRMILNAWWAIPAERFRLAQSLGFAPRDIWQHLEWPMLRGVLPAAFVAVFSVCLTSFAVVLLLGGGPAATTVELAIWQAVRFDFDLGRAAVLAVVQVALCLTVVWIGWHLVQPAGFGAGRGRKSVIPAPRGWRLIVDLAVIALAALFLLLPMAEIVLRGVPYLTGLPMTIWQAALVSIGIAVTSAVITVWLALILTLFIAKGGWAASMVDGMAMLPLAASPLVLGTGLFLLIQPFASPPDVAIWVTLLVNITLSLPFAYRLLEPEVQTVLTDYGRLAASLGMRHGAALRLVILPRVARALGFAAGLSAALSMGDLGTMALFAGDDWVTLPLALQRLAGAYRMAEASAAAVLLCALAFGLFFIFDHWGRRRGC